MQAEYNDSTSDMQLLVLAKEYNDRPGVIVFLHRVGRIDLAVDFYKHLRAGDKVYSPPISGVAKNVNWESPLPFLFFFRFFVSIFFCLFLLLLPSFFLLHFFCF